MVGQLRWTPEARQPTQQLTEVKEEISLSGLNPCPDEEGIKTLRLGARLLVSGLNPCPDEEGIKTISDAPMPPESSV